MKWLKRLFGGGLTYRATVGSALCIVDSQVMLNDLLNRTAGAVAHRVCIAQEHDPASGKVHGCCIVCGDPWPCETAKQFMPNNMLSVSGERKETDAKH